MRGHNDSIYTIHTKVFTIAIGQFTPKFLLATVEVQPIIRYWQLEKNMGPTEAIGVFMRQMHISL